MTSATSEGAQGIFSKGTFLKSVHSEEKDEACLVFLVKSFTKSVHRGGVNKKLALSLQLQTDQILKNDDQMFIFCLSYLMTTVGPHCLRHLTVFRSGQV